MSAELEDMKKKAEYLTERNEEIDAKAYVLLKKRNEIVDGIKEPVAQLAIIEQQLNGLGIEKDRLLMEKGRAIDQIITLEEREATKEQATGLYQ